MFLPKKFAQASICIGEAKELIKKLVRAMHRNLSIPFQIFSALLETNAC